jgi:hypothetical protein
MKKDSQYITIEDNTIGSVFIFGSWCTSEKPNDLDLVLIYDEHKCFPEMALSIRRAFERHGSMLGFPPVHVVLLNISEAIECDFVHAENGKLMQEWLKTANDNNLGLLLENVEKCCGVKFGYRLKS